VNACVKKKKKHKNTKTLKRGLRPTDPPPDEGRLSSLNLHVEGGWFFCDHLLLTTYYLLLTTYYPYPDIITLTYIIMAIHTSYLYAYDKRHTPTPTFVFVRARARVCSGAPSNIAYIQYKYSIRIRIHKDQRYTKIKI